MERKASQVLKATTTTAARSRPVRAFWFLSAIVWEVVLDGFIA